MVPITLGLGLINFNAFVDTIFAARLLDKYQAPSSINAAFRLYIFPQGMFSVAVATVLFPSLSRLATRRDFDGFRSMVTGGLRQIAFLLIPASVICAVLAEPIVRLVYQRGDFTAVPDHGRRRLPRGLLARPRLQRRDADVEPRLLLPPGGVDPDGGCARQPRAERRARRRLLPARHLGDPALDLAGEHRGHGRAPDPAPPAARPAGRHPDDELRPPDQPRVGSCSPASPTGSGGRSTTRSGAGSSPRSCRSGLALAGGAAAYVLVCRLLRVDELRALRLLRRRPATP